MCRRARATNRTHGRWIVGQRGPLVWCLYWYPRATSHRVMFTRMVLGRYERWKVIFWGEQEMAKRLKADEVSVNGELDAPSGGEFAKHAPQLCSWLLDAVYEDGTPKGKTRLQLQRQGGQVELVLKDADSGLCLTVKHESLSDALMTMELLLGSDECPWQLDPWPMRGASRKRKK